MDLGLTGSTVLILGVGDGVDHALVRELSEAGASTLTATRETSDRALGQPDRTTQHWTSVEEGIDEATVTRLIAFLKEQGRTPDAVVAQIDIDDAFKQRRRLPLWWMPRRAHLTEAMDELLRAVLASITPGRRSSVILVFRVRGSIPEFAVYDWLERAMLAVLERAREVGNEGVRVNAVLVADTDVYSEAAHVIAFLASPLSARISGAYIPVDDGQLLARE